MPQSGLWLPPRGYNSLTSTSWSSSALIDATGEKIACIGRVWNPASTTKSIRKVGFPFGSVTKAGGSGLTLSLQDVDLTSGPAYRPDGTQDETYAIANGNSSFASNTWFMSGDLSADRSVAFGELIAVVLEYDGSGRLGSDSVVMRGPNGGQGRQLGRALYTASWAAIDGCPAILFEFSDGTYGSFDAGMPLSEPIAQLSYGSTSNPDEYALKFTPPFNCKCDGAWLLFYGNTGDADIVLYEGTTSLVSVSLDANAAYSAFNNDTLVTFPEQSLTAGTTYYLAVKPTTSTAVQPFDIAVANSAYWQAFPGGADFSYATRVDGGAWSANAARRLVAGVRLYPTASGGSGGLLAHPGMRGGFV